jgi:hypothetical protein
MKERSTYILSGMLCLSEIIGGAIHVKKLIPLEVWIDTIRMDLVEAGWGVWTGLVWLRIGTGGEL